MTNLIQAPLPDDFALAHGSHADREKGMCLLEAVAYVAGEPHSDHPLCVDPVLGAFGRAVNDFMTEDERKLLVPIVSLLVGTAGDHTLSLRRAMLICDATVRQILPIAFDGIGLTDVAETLRALSEVKDAASASAAFYAASAADSAASAARSAARSVARSAAHSAASYAGYYAADSAARSAAHSAGYYAADSAAGAADSAANSAAYSAASAAHSAANSAACAANSAANSAADSAADSAAFYAASAATHAAARKPVIDALITVFHAAIRVELTGWLSRIACDVLD